MIIKQVLSRTFLEVFEIYTRKERLPKPSLNRSFLEAFEIYIRKVWLSSES